MEHTPPLPDQLEEAQRELAQKQRLYPGWITKGQIDPGLAERRLLRQQGIVATLTWLVEEDSGQLSLLERGHS